MTRSTPKQDILHRFVFDAADIRGEILTLGASYRAATAHQYLPPPVQALLGQFLVAASLMAEMFKFEGTLTLQVRGDGAIPLIMAEATHQRNLRGIARLKENTDSNDLNEKTFPELLGQGVMSITVDPIKGQRYQGVVPLEGQTLAECLSHYFAQSEQLPTRLWLCANSQSAAGLLLQALPPAGGQLRDPEQWLTAEQLANTVTETEQLTLDHPTLLRRLFHEFDVRLFEPESVQFVCSCSRERSANALTALGREDAYALLAELDNIDMDCQFCGAHYQFGAEDLEDLFGGSGKSVH